MEDDDFLEMAEAVGKNEDLTEEDREFLEKIISLLRDEKTLPTKDRKRLVEMYKEVVGEKKKEDDPNEDIDEDDFV